MKKLKIMCLVLFVLFSMAGVGYSACEGDLNCDGDTDGADMALFAADFGTTGCGTCDDVIARIDELEDRISQLEGLLQHFVRSGNDIYIEGANLHIRNGRGSTDGMLNGLGNLIVGYNEERGGGEDDRSGSHNIVVGSYHNFNDYGGLVAGNQNTISGAYASISGGRLNTASGNYASVSGGQNNTASYTDTSISGGKENTASGFAASISGGRHNTASGYYTFVGGGGGTINSDGNIAFADYSSILGGWRNIAGDPDLSDHGLGTQSVVSAGSSNVASGERSAVSGGYDNVASGAGSSVSGGKDNTANALGTSVSGGNFTTVSDNYDWAAGDIYEPE